MKLYKIVLQQSAQYFLNWLNVSEGGTTDVKLALANYVGGPQISILRVDEHLVILYWL